jgi:outer membrane protein TolC
MLVSIHTQIRWILFFLMGTFTSKAQIWTIEQCLDTAQLYNINLQINRNNLMIGLEKEKEAKANLIPKLTANADYRYYLNLPYQLLPVNAFNPAVPEGEYRAIQFGVPHTINANLQLSMPLYNPQVYGSIQSTQIASEVTELQYKKTEEQVFFDVSNLYYNAQVLHHQLSFIDSNIINADRLLKNMQLLNQQQLIIGTDVSKSKLKVLQLNTQREKIRSQYEQVLNALKLAMGVSTERQLEIVTDVFYQPGIEYTSSATLELSMLQTQNRLLKSELSTLNKSRFLPSLNLIGIYGTTGFGYNGQPSAFLDFYPIGFAGIQLSYPLFNGTVTLKKLNQKKLEIKNNALQSDLLMKQNNMLIENAKLQREVAKSSVETTAEQIQLSQTVYQHLILQQEQKTASLSDVLIADNALREAQQTYLLALVDYLKADLELKKLTGNILKAK